MRHCDKVYIRKSSGFDLYKWCPQPNDFGKKENIERRPYFCDARPNSQGQDWKTTYCYNIVLINNVQKRMAYVACDYVQ